MTAATTPATARLWDAVQELDGARAFLRDCDPDLTDYAVLRLAAAEARTAAEWRRVRAERAANDPVPSA